MGGSQSVKLPAPGPPFEGEVRGFEMNYEYGDCEFGVTFPKEVIQKCEEFEFDSSDVVLAAYPKTGNTWMRQLIWLITSSDDLEAATSTEVNIQQRFPLMEMKVGKDIPAGVDILNMQPAPRLVNTHLPYNLIGPALEKANPKIVLILRNPKDQLVSYFHFFNAMPFSKVEKFGDFFNLAVNGKVWFGSYLKHLSAWYDQSKTKSNICAFVYEDMQKDLLGNIDRLAKFLGKELDDDKIKAIAEASSFKSMQVNLMIGEEAGPGAKMMAKSWFRKGVVGDAENHFTPEQHAIVESLTKDLASKGLKFQYKI